MSAGSEYFRVEKRGSVHLVTLDNPPYNAGHAHLFEAGAKAMEALGSDPETKAIVLTGAGDNFTRGMDVKVAAGLDDEGRINLPNPSAGRLLETRGDEMIGRQFADIVPEMAHPP